MDPSLDPPPHSQPAAVVIPTITATADNHPPYAEMIPAAIAALNEPEGSSKRAIAKYIETRYSHLPPTHSALLTHHLKQLKTNGQLLMVKHSYKLPTPGSATPAPINGAESASAAVAKRRPGRPPKPKPDAVQAAVPVFRPPINVNDVPEAAQPAVNGAAPVRGRGRPPKRGPGLPPRSGGPAASGGVGKRGRPRKNAAPIAVVGGTGKRPRGRPPKPISVVEGGANLGGGIAATPVGVPAPVAGKRRGRPPKAGNEAKRPRNMNAAVAKPPRKLSGKPLGRPRKNAQGTGNQTQDSEGMGYRTQDSQLLVAYLDLKAKLENLQAMVKQTAALVRPSLNSEVAINAIHQLELAAVNAPNVQAPQQQPLLDEQVQPQS